MPFQYNAMNIHFKLYVVEASAALDMYMLRTHVVHIPTYTKYIISVCTIFMSQTYNLLS